MEKLLEANLSTPTGQFLQAAGFFYFSLDFDVVGAKSFGFKVCWIDSTEAPADPLGPRPNSVVKNFVELVEAL